MTVAPPIPAEVRALLARIGPVWGTSVQAHVRAVLEAFGPVLETAPKRAIVVRDVAYGPDPRHRLDVYRPVDPPTDGHGHAMLLFVHGGAFVDGDKDRTAEIYSNVCWYFARHGVIAINVEFRLAPMHPFPAGTLDVAAAVEWARRHAASLGGDPARVFLMGHSAGGAHAAHYAYDRRHHPADGPGLAGLIVVSGRVRAEDGAENPNAARVRAYYRSAEEMREGSAVNHVDAGCPPTMIAVAQWENPLIDVHCAELAHRLAQVRRRAPRFVWLPGHTHTSIVAHFNTAEDLLGRHVLEFIERPG